MLVRRNNFKEVIEAFKPTGLYGFDTEATGLYPYNGDILFSVILSNEEQSFYLNFQKYPDLSEEWVLPREWLPQLQECLDNPASTWAIANAKYDMGILANEGLEIKGTVHCTEAVGRVVYNRHFTYGLDAAGERAGLGKKQDTVKEYIKKHKLYTNVKVDGKKQDTTLMHFEKVPLNIIHPYGERDGELVRKVAVHQINKLAEIQVTMPVGKPTPVDIFLMEKKLTKVCFSMEKVGARVNLDYCREALTHELNVARVAVSDFERLSGMVFVDHANTLAKAFDAAGEAYPRTAPTKTRPQGSPSFTAEVLDGFDTPLAGIVLKYRRAQKRANTYFRNFIDFADVHERVHANIRQGGTDTGRMSYSEPNCLSLDTEVLTKDGWKTYKEVSLQDQVACYDKDFGLITFQKPTKKYVSRKERALLSFDNQHASILVTPNHRCLFKNRRTKELYTCAAENFRKDAHILHGGFTLGLKNLFDNDATIQLLAAIQADGSFTSGQQIDFCFSKERKYKRLIEILDALLIPYNIGKSNRLRLRIKKDLSLFKGCLTKNKKFTYELLNLSYHERGIFLRELKEWDGLSTRPAIEYYSNIKSNVDIVQALASLHNKRALIYEYTNSTGGFCYILRITDRNYSSTANIKRRKAAGKVWCLEVPTSYMLVRRNEKTFITGNCQNLPKTKKGDTQPYPVRRAYIPTNAEWAFFPIDYRQMEYRLMLEYAGEKKLIEQVLDGVDVHDATAEMLGISRDKAKTQNFMLIYGGGAGKLATALKVSMEEAYSLKNEYFSRLPKVVAFVSEVKRVAEQRGFIHNWAGRRCYFPEYRGKDGKLTRGTHAAPNHLIQGGCADVVKKAMIECAEHIIKKKARTRMLLQVHDELIFEAPRGEFDIIPELAKIMESVYPAKHLPLLVDIEHSFTSWEDKIKGMP